MIRHLTITILRRGNEIALGEKLRGFGEGKITEPGGKVEAGESFEEAAIRETLEETGVKVSVIQNRGQVIFRDLYYKGVPETNIMHVFVSDNFSGELTDTDELKNKWYSIDDIPYDKMWGDAKYWLPEVLKGHTIDAFFRYDSNNEFTEYGVNIVPAKEVLDEQFEH